MSSILLVQLSTMPSEQSVVAAQALESNVQVAPSLGVAVAQPDAVVSVTAAQLAGVVAASAHVVVVLSQAHALLVVPETIFVQFQSLSLFS